MWYAGVLTIVFVFLGVLTLLFLHHYLEASLRNIQARRARQIADTLLVQAGRDDEAAPGPQLEDLYSPEANDRFIRITRDNGELV